MFMSWFPPEVLLNKAQNIAKLLQDRQIFI